MKKIFTLLLTLLLGGIAAQAQDAGYQPLVREGVKWLNTTQFIYYGGIDGDYYGPIVTYTMQFAGDTVITSDSGTHVYKKLITSSDNYFMREEGKKIYRLDENEQSLDVTDLPTERLLYDFSDENQATLCGQVNFNYEGTIEIDGHPCRVFHDHDSGRFGHLIESVGLVSGRNGDLISQRWGEPAGGDYYYGLDHMEDLAGNGIYLPPWKASKPLVREGVRWIYRKGNDATSWSYYAIEFEGDTVIEPSNMPWACSYKKCYRFIVDKEEMHAPVNHNNETPVAYMRDYGVSHTMISRDAVEQHSNGFPPESYIYSFSCPCLAYLESDGNLMTFSLTESAVISNHECRVFADATGSEGDKLIETIGLVSASHGDLLGMVSDDASDGKCGLSHVIDADGTIIYKGPCYQSLACDLTGDGQVDISDVNAAIDVMLGKSAADADITDDGQVDIADVNAIIDQMLGKR